MNTADARFYIRGMPVNVKYKDIKNLHIGVYPPQGAVRVAAPRRLEEAQVRLAVIQRLSWIKRQQRQLQQAARQSVREMVSGESHYVWGSRLRLTVKERPGRAHVEIDGSRLLLYMPNGSDREARAKALERWQRSELRRAIPQLISQWEPVVGRHVTQWGIKQMKTKWGSCNREAGRIWINLELVKKHPNSLEYVVVHEMTHMLVRNHGTSFIALMDKFMPDWRSRKDLLNDAPLSDELWNEELGRVSQSDRAGAQAVSSHATSHMQRQTPWKPCIDGYGKGPRVHAAPLGHLLATVHLLWPRRLAEMTIEGDLVHGRKGGWIHTWPVQK